MRKAIQRFCDKYELDFYEGIRIEVVTDISEYIRADDLEYYNNRKEQIDYAYGMLYENSNKQWIILIKKQDEYDFLMTLFHEYVHLCDYKKLSKIRDNSIFRELQEDYVFLFWTEFHATYLSYRFFLHICSKNIKVKMVQNEIVNDLKEYFSSSTTLDKNEVMDKTVRSYGSYVALYDEFCNEVELYPKQYYYDEVFFEIYKFLNNYKTFDEFIIVYDDFNDLLLKIK